MPETITHLLTRDHTHCDDLFAAADTAAPGEAARAGWTAFIAAMQRHLDAEEGTLFPAIERAAGAPLPPVRVMRMEHAQMRELFGEITEAASQSDWDEVSGLAQTLLLVMQQHNLKEQNVLYPIADRLLGAGAADFTTRFAQLGGR